MRLVSLGSVYRYWCVTLYYVHIRLKIGHRVAVAVTTFVLAGSLVGTGWYAYFLNSRLQAKKNTAQTPQVSPFPPAPVQKAPKPPKPPEQTPVQKPAPAPPVSKAPTPAPSSTLFWDALNGKDRVVTSEFAHWNPNSGCANTSPLWDMTSGSLFVKNAVGYSGKPSIDADVTCNADSATNSAVFRLTTKDHSFKNVNVSFDYFVIARGSAAANSYDGLHTWVGYQNSAALYAASIFRWDRMTVIKKKTPQSTAGCTEVSEGGCYSDFVGAVANPRATEGTWHTASITFQVNQSGHTVITEMIDGQQLLQVVDDGSSGKPYASGAVGVRGDNTEFYLKNFKVATL